MKKSIKNFEDKKVKNPKTIKGGGNKETTKSTFGLSSVSISIRA